jgi:hypothetical protein
MALLPTQVLPETDPIGTDPSGNRIRIEHNWYLLLTNLCLQALGNPGVDSAISITVGASPYAYQAPANGMVVVSGGTVSKLTISRGTLTVTPGPLQGQFQLSKNDTITVTYAYGSGIGKSNSIPYAAPRMTFFQG